MQTIALLVIALLDVQSTSAWFWSTPDTQVADTLLSSNLPVNAEARFNNLDGVSGSFKFMQLSPNDATEVKYNIAGLKGNNKFYHVHVRRVPNFQVDKVHKNASLLQDLCSEQAVGGHLNPFKITQKLAPKSAPFDKYETGDLSGKHGPLLLALDDKNNTIQDQYSGRYRDKFLWLTGENGIIGRSIVIHKNDGKRWVCATIEQVTANPHFLT